MEKDRGENSLKQQLTGVLAFTGVPLPEEKKRDVISSHDSDKSFNPAEPPFFGFSFGGIPSRPRSKPSSIPQRRVNREWISPVTPSKNESQFANSESKVPKTRVNREWISPVTPSKNESQFSNSESEVPETDSPVQRKQKRKKYKPKVVDDGNKLTKSRPANFTSNPSERNSFPISPDLKYTNAKDQTAAVPKPQGPSGPITPGPKPTTPEAPVTPEPISQHKRAHNTPDPKYENPERIRLSGAADLNPEKLEFETVTSDPNPGSVQFFVGRKRGLHINSDETIAGTELIIEKSSMVMQLSNDNVLKPVKSVRRRLDFIHEDYIEQVNPNMDKSSTPINLNCDDLIEIVQPLREENMAGITRSPEKSTDITTSSDSDNANKPLQLVSNGLNFDLGDKTELVILGKVGSGMDPSLNQAGIEKFKRLAEDIFDQIGPKDNLFQFTTQRFRGGKRERAPKSKLDEMLDEIILKMKHMKLYENALIPYQEKKEKYRGLVALDKDSLVEWNLLMGEGGSKSAPGANPEREEKWRKERNTFRNLAECFIAKMKLIQGDRRFSEWKGSVVDSVVGAFLTQNVSDQLSSSAFISLSARYPRQRDGNATWPEKKFSDFEWTKSRLVDQPTCAADIVDPQIESRQQKVPEDNTPQEFTKERSGSHKAKKVNNLSGKKGYRIGMEHVEWDNLRKEASYTREGRSVKREDAADWDAVRQADTGEVAKAIHGRGQDNVLAERIQDFLNRVAEDHGSVDLEWLREIPGDQAKEYLLSIYGLGLKSVECVRLLALQQVAFPVDTNVGRICVRLGWVPLQPLPESVQIHLLEMYPVLDSIQKYLWPRLCKLDQKTLYELHYQLITFGKVFCTKSKPNCNACPLRSECKHFASAFASARLTLPGPQEKQENKVVLWNGAPSAFQNASKSFYNPTDLPASQFTCLPRNSNSEPIIEEPMTPEEEHIVEELPDIEDFCFDDSDEIPTINLNMESFVKNIEELVRTNDSELQIEDISKALVLLPPIATSIPPPKLKHSRHLRTVHDAYELPDDHPILRWLEFEERDPDDPSPYLLILYSPEKEIADCKQCLCTSCNQTKSCDFLSKEEEIEYVKCSIMIPCRTATRGGFPLNGTYFQVNEVFADHVTARNPVMVPREEIWRLRRHPVYFGSTISSILKGLSTEEVQYCFWRGFVCVREFDRVNRYPKPLSSWLHILPTVKKKLQQTKS